MTTNLKFARDDCEILEREILYQGIFRLALYTIRHRLFEGGWSETFTREVFERHSATGILPYDPVLDRVVLIEQFRPGSLSDPRSPWLIEIPAGVLGKDEQPDEVAFREATEETGCTIQSLRPIFDYFVSPGGSNEYIHLYCGKVDSRGVEGVHGLKYEHEDIRVWNLSVDAAMEMMRAGEIKTAPALISLLWLQQHREELRAVWS